jgi:alkanesulfonate monooxygenase SsuD/methylene tetrahydromethanopterin reductase-like flavin-dependent oxidoreductase (luciferase family)
MTEVAGEVADGIFVHGFSTERNLRERTVPALEQGLRKSGRNRADVELSYPLFVITGEDAAEFEKADAAVREQIAFFQEMGARLPTELVDAFAVRGAVDELPAIISERYGDIIDRVSLYAPYRPEPDRWAGLVASVKELADVTH